MKDGRESTNLSASRPNILFIELDQLRYDCVGYANAYPVSTPNIDRLAREGIVFTQAYTPIPLCSPARQAMVTGQRPEALGTHWNYNLGPLIPDLEPGGFSWASLLKARGYQTGYVGKWHVSKHDPTAFGYDDYVSEGAYRKFAASRYPDTRLQEAPFGFEPDPVPLEDTRTHWLAQRAIDLLRNYAQQEQPWHLRFDTSEPHPPYHPAQEFYDQYPPSEVPQWHNFFDDFEHKPYIQRQQLWNWDLENYTWEDWAPVVASYYASISQVDDAIGRILQTLDELGMTDKTMVVFTSDHGDMCGSHRMFDKHYILYDDVVRVPLVVRWPGRIAPGSCCNAFVSNALDWPATIADWFKADEQTVLHGDSLLPFFMGEEQPQWRQSIISTYNGQQFGLYNQRMLRTERWKYIWNPTDVDEFYDLLTDPGELKNRIAEPELQDRIHEYRQQLFKELTQQGDRLLKNLWMEGQLLGRGRKLS